METASNTKHIFKEVLLYITFFIVFIILANLGLALGDSVGLRFTDFFLLILLIPFLFLYIFFIISIRWLNRRFLKEEANEEILHEKLVKNSFIVVSLVNFFSGMILLTIFFLFSMGTAWVLGYTPSLLENLVSLYILSHITYSIMVPFLVILFSFFGKISHKIKLTLLVLSCAVMVCGLFSLFLGFIFLLINF